MHYFLGQFGPVQSTLKNVMKQELQVIVAEERYTKMISFASTIKIYSGSLNKNQAN